MAHFYHPELPVGAFIAAVLVVIPLPWHWRARNIATLAIMAWLFVVNIINGVNSILWAGNVVIRIPVWCDITTKIYVGSSFALPAATMCICKHLELVSSTRTVRLDHSDKRRRMIFDSFMCFGVPFVFMGLHYIVQGHRFDIIEDIGCSAAVYNSIQSIMLLLFPPLLLSTITLVYAGMALAHFTRRRIDFGRHLQNKGSALTTNRYGRLIAMSLTEMVWGTILNALNVYSNVSLGLRPYLSWAIVHSDFSRIAQWPTVFLPPDLRRREMLFWWALPVSSFIFFLFFGFGEEAFKEYRKLFAWIRIHVFRQTIKPQLHFGNVLDKSRNHRPVVLASLPTIDVGNDVEKGSRKMDLSYTSEPTALATDTPTMYYSFQATTPSTSSYSVADSLERHSPISNPHPDLAMPARTHDPARIDGPIYIPDYHRPFSPHDTYPVHKNTPSS